MSDITKPIVHETGPLVQTLNPETLIAKALESNVPVETLERLLAMRSELKAEQAQEAFNAAMSKFQSECPIIRKTREIKVNGQVRSRYASLDDILEQVSPIMKECGLSYTVDTESKGNEVVIMFEVHHILGHSRLTRFTVPIEEVAYMNDAQKTASALTFGKRYAFQNAFGILTGDQDDDGQASGQAADPKVLYQRFILHTQALWNNLESVRFLKDEAANKDAGKVAEALEELDDETQIALNLAPSKGGIFTTQERAFLHSHEVAEARRAIKADK